MARNPRTSSSPRPGLGLCLILVGIAALTLSPRTATAELTSPWDSFAHGALIGAGLTLVLMGVYLVGARSRRARSDWLPSRDGDDQR